MFTVIAESKIPYEKIGLMKITVINGYLHLSEKYLVFF